MQSSITNYGSSLSSALYGKSSVLDTGALTKDTTSQEKKTATTSTSSSAYNLDLSAAAQKYLKQQQDAKKNYGFQLMPKELSKLSEIIGKYKEAEMTPENLRKMQADLKAAGVDAPRLAAKDMVRTFSSGATMLDALSGKTTLVSPQEKVKTLKTKTTNFLDQIVGDWNQLKVKDADYKKLPKNLSELMELSAS
jgi:aminoglycoside/choline kinase family phosphotransferase